MKPPDFIKRMITDYGVPASVRSDIDRLEHKINEIIDYLSKLHEQQKPCESTEKIKPKIKPIGYANRAIRISDAIYNSDIRETL